MVELKQTLNKDVVVKLAGLAASSSCRVVNIEETGIWLASQDLQDKIRSSSGQAVLPAGYAKVFVPFAQLDFLVFGTEDQSAPSPPGH